MKNLCRWSGGPDVVRDANVAAGTFFRRELLKRLDGWAAGDLQARGLGFVLTADSRWRTGYAPDGWSYLVDHLRSLGFEDGALIRAGLAVMTPQGYVVDRFRDKIMFVAEGVDRDSIGFVGQGYRRSSPGRTAESPVAGRHPALVGISEQEGELAAGAVPVIVRWPADALAVYVADQGESKWAGIALCGTTMSLRQARLLRTYAAAGTVIVALGRGRVARDAAAGLLTTLSAAFGRVLVADLRDGDEPGSISRSGGGPGRLRRELAATRPLAGLAIELELMRRRRCSSRRSPGPHPRSA